MIWSTRLTFDSKIIIKYFFVFLNVFSNFNANSFQFWFFKSPSTPNLEKQPSENGVSVQNENFEEIINLPIGSKSSRLDVANSESPEIPLNPILAFDDEGTLGPLPQVDGVQTQQTAGKLALHNHHRYVTLREGMNLLQYDCWHVAVGPHGKDCIWIIETEFWVGLGNFLGLSRSPTW